MLDAHPYQRNRVFTEIKGFDARFWQKNPVSGYPCVQDYTIDLGLLE